MSERFNRNISFFGEEGQNKVRATHVAVVGIGGLGTHVVQQLALLGVGHFSFIDKEEIDRTNLNRYIGVRHSDPIPGTKKVDIAERIVREINPDLIVDRIPFSLISEQAFEAVIRADYVFGCLDREGVRLILNELCAAYAKPYFDLASEIIPGENPVYGGRVCVAWDGKGCIFCYNEIDIAEAQIDLENPDWHRNRQSLYGVQYDLLGSGGPSVVSINGVVASIGVTEFILAVTGIRTPKRLCTYRGNMGIVSTTSEEPAPGCYYCKGIRGLGDAVNVKRYINSGVAL